MTDKPEDRNIEEGRREEPGPEADEGETGSAAGDAPPGGRAASRGSGRAPALLALLLALAAAGLAGWAAWQTWRFQETGNDVDSRFIELEQRLERLDGAVEDLSGGPEEAAATASRALERADGALQAAGNLEGDLERLRDTTVELSREIADLQGGQSELSRRMDDIASRLEGRADDAPVRRLALAQAEYLVRAAYRMLELEADPSRAARALALAAGQLADVSAPGLTRVREALARELEAVRAVEPVDRAGLAGRLAALAERSGSLPLRDRWRGAGFAPEGAGTPPADEGAERGWWQATTDFLGEYFTVRRTDEAGTALPDPATLRLMRDVLRLELEQARAALLRAQPELYRQSLERAASLLEQHFATEAAPVRSALEAVRELARRDVAPAMPEHGAALDALTDLRSRDRGAG